MSVYSHSVVDDSGRRVGSKLLKQHTMSVRDIAACIFNNKICFDVSIVDVCNMLNTACIFHDFGKYTEYFQTYLVGGVVNDYKQHSRIGAIVAFNSLKYKDMYSAIIVYYLIKNHHGDLSNINDDKMFDTNEKLLVLNLIEHQTEKLANYSKIECELGVSNIQEFVKFPEENFRRIFNELFAKEPNICNYYLINYLFSILIQADKMDASDNSIYKRCSISNNVVDDYIKTLHHNQIRDCVRKTIVSNVDMINLQIHKIFTLTAPTGIGKTLAIVDFAIQLRNKIKNEYGVESQIIYSVPFVNIIEQTLRVFEGVFPTNIKILAHYQYANVEGDSNNQDQNVLTLETWQSDIMITSFVQLLHTIVGYKNKIIKKFNNLAGAIIIMDEVQTIKAEYMPLVGCVLYYLTEYLDAKIILMTATKPLIFELANKHILRDRGCEAIPFELLTNHVDVFSKFNRTKIISKLDVDITDMCNFIDIFDGEWDITKSCLIVCNTVNTSLKVHSLIKNYLNSNGYNNNLYYMSTNILPCKRLGVIESIKTELLSNLNPILVSTQVVEAGVDLDFDMGFRDIAPLDSIIQVAGRINRNNNVEKSESPLFIVDFNDSYKVYGHITPSETVVVIKSYPCGIPESKYLEAVGLYYDGLMSKDRLCYDKSIKLFNGMERLEYTKSLNNIPICDFRVIEENNTKSVFVELDGCATMCLDKYRLLLDKKITKEEFYPYKTRFYTYIIQLLDVYVGNIQDMVCDNILLIKKDVVKYYYNMNTGFIRSQIQINIGDYIL